jgi:hypothetical protein
MRSLQKSTRILSCGITATTRRASRSAAANSEEHFLRSQRTAEIGSARAIAEAWRQAVIANGGFTELRADETPAINDAESENASLRGEISGLRKAGARLDSEVDAQLTQEVTDVLRAAGYEALLLRYMAAQQWFNGTRASPCKPGLRTTGNRPQGV